MAPLYWLKRPIAHRGFHDAARGIVENSASAVTAAMSRGYAIEVDVQCAAGDRPIVFHDITLDRLTDETGPVAVQDVEALCAIQLKGSEDRILSLTDLLELVGGYVPLILEVKGTSTRDGTLEANIAQELSDYPGPVAVMSFDPYAVAAFLKSTPALPRGLVAGRFNDAEHRHGLSLLQRFARRHLLTSAFAQPHFIAYDVNALPAVAPLVAKGLFGLPLLAWTVKTEADRTRALRYADAIIFEGIEP